MSEMNKKYVKAIIENYVQLQKYSLIKEKYREHRTQLMREIEDDLDTIEDLSKQIKLIKDPLKRREKSDWRRYLIEICKEKVRIVNEHNKVLDLIDDAFWLNQK